MFTTYRASELIRFDTEVLVQLNATFRLPLSALTQFAARF